MCETVDMKYTRSKSHKIRIQKGVSQVYRAPMSFSYSGAIKMPVLFQNNNALFAAALCFPNSSVYNAGIQLLIPGLLNGHAHTKDPALGPVPPSVKLELRGVPLNRKSGLDPLRLVCRSP